MINYLSKGPRQLVAAVAEVLNCLRDGYAAQRDLQMEVVGNQEVVVKHPHQDQLDHKIRLTELHGCLDKFVGWRFVASEKVSDTGNSGATQNEVQLACLILCRRGPHLHRPFAACVIRHKVAFLC